MALPSSVLRVPPRLTPPSHLAVLLHGVGARAASLAPLANAIARKFPTLAFSIPEAPHVFDHGARGRQWFSITGVTEANRPARVMAAMPDFERFLQNECQRYEVASDKLVLIGFSQGAIMALEYASHGGRAAGVISLSGRLAAPPPTEGNARAPIRMLHGEDDPIIEVSYAKKTCTWFNTAGVDVSLQTFEGLGHSIDDRVSQGVEEALNETLLVQA